MDGARPGGLQLRAVYFPRPGIRAVISIRKTEPSMWLQVNAAERVLLRVLLAPDELVAGYVRL